MITEVVSVTLFENSSFIINDTQGPWKSTAPKMNVGAHFHGQHDTKTSPVFLE